MAVWLAFELGVGPALGVQYPAQNRVVGRGAVVVDHLLYGIVVAGRTGLGSERSAT